MKKMIVLLATLVALPAFAVEKEPCCTNHHEGAHAALSPVTVDAERLKLAEELLTLMRFDRNMEQSFAAARQMQLAQLKAVNLSRLDAAAAAEVRERTMDVLQKELSWAKMKDEYIAAYAVALTKDELKAFVEFYRSPAAKAYVEKVPELMKRSAEISQRRVMAIGPQVQAIVRDVAEQQKALAPLNAVQGSPKAALPGGK